VIAGKGAVCAGLSVLLISGCAGGVDQLSVPDPPKTTVAAPAPPLTLPANLDAIGEAPVEGVTTTTQPAIGPGAASLSGSVTDQSGQSVAGATVEIDRAVGEQYVSATTTAAANGSWSFHGILGGIYRIRAWKAPNVGMPTPSQLFLADGASQTVDLQATSYPTDQIQVAINPSQPTVGQPLDLVVQVTSPAVNASGVLTSPPLPGATVTLVNGSNWQVDNGNPLTTNAYGQALFEVTCGVAGTDPLSAEVDNATPTDLSMPACAPAPSPTTTTTVPYDYYSTTTCPPSDASTTTYPFGGSC
jgi:hypothetical protein